jgi:drug/metabolite transporter (DMT)-like permease
MPPPRPLDVPAAAIALLLAALWGANPVAIKIGLVDAPPLRLAWMRFLIGGLVVVIWAFATGRGAAFRVTGGEWRPLLFLGALFTIQLGCMNVGTDLTSASHSALLLNTYAVHTVVLAHFTIPGDRMTPRTAAGTLLAYAGVVVLFARQWSAGSGTLTGDLLVSASAVLLAERTVYLARAIQRLDAVKLLLAQASVGTLAFVVLSAVVEAHVPTRWTPSLGMSIFYQGVVIAGFNFIVNLWLLKHYRPSLLAGFFLTTPIFGVIIAALLTGDPLTGDLLLASLLVAAGIGLSGR